MGQLVWLDEFALSIAGIDLVLKPKKNDEGCEGYEKYKNSRNKKKSNDYWILFGRIENV